MTDTFQLHDPLSTETKEPLDRATMLLLAEEYSKQGRFADVLDIYRSLAEWERMATYLTRMGQFVEAGTSWMQILPFLPVQAGALKPAERVAARSAAIAYGRAGLHLTAAGLWLSLGERTEALDVLTSGGFESEKASLQRGEGLPGNPWPDGLISSRAPDHALASAQTSEYRGNDGQDLPSLAARLDGNDSPTAIDILIQVDIADPHYLDVADLVARLCFEHGLMSAKVAHFLDPLLTGEGLGGRQPGAETLYTLGCLHEDIGVKEQAATAFTHALAVEPSHRAASIRLEELRREKHERSEMAGDPFSLSIEMKPTDDDRERLRERISTTTVEFQMGPLGPGSVVAGRFHLIEPLGEGGCGVVFAARDAETNEEVALKVLRAGTGELRAVQRFEREIAISRSLKHPNVVATRDSGVWHELYWIAMERLDGIDLGVLLRRVGRPLPVLPALRVLRAAAQGLEYAHTSGVIHRDIKPSNIFVMRRTHHVKLLDFGLALVNNATRFTQVGTTLGSARYMAPERLRGDTGIGPWSDLYALGVVLYRMLTATMPFKEKNLSSLVTEMEAVTPPPPSILNPNVPADLDLIVAQLLAKDPAARYQSAERLLEDLAPVEQRMTQASGDL